MINSIYNPGIDKMAIIQQYIDIVFADITDYVEFGNEEVVTKKGIETRPSVRLKIDMIEAHPGPIKEITANGYKVKIKLHNKMEALDKLSRYLPTLMYEKYEQQYGSLKIICEIQKSEIEKLDGGWMKEEDFYNKFKSNLQLCVSVNSGIEAIQVFPTSGER